MTETTKSTKKRSYTEEERERAVACFNSRLGYKRTARELGIPVGTCRDWSRRWQMLGDSKGSGRKSQLTGPVKRRIAQLRKRGYTYVGISSIVGISSQTIRRYCIVTGISEARHHAKRDE